MPRRFVPLLCLLVLLFRCGPGSVSTLKREELFSLSLGKMEDQIDLFLVDGARLNHQNSVYLKGGRVYVANGGSSKIMEFTSYGDLVFMLYNSELNPQPVVLRRSEETANRRAQTYPFLDIAQLAVDGAKRLYVVDSVDPNQRQVDEESGATLLSRVLRFDRNGNQIDYLGQEGVRGTPFPFVSGLKITAQDDTVVICRIPPTRWIVYWFDRTGMLMYRVEIDVENLPGMKDAVPFLESIHPDYHRHDLLLALSYYRNDINPSTRTLESVSQIAQRVYRFDVAAEQYRGHIEIPNSGERRERVGGAELQISAPSFQLIGNTQSGHLFLLRPDAPNQYVLLVLDERGREVAQRVITIEDSELFFKTLSLSDEGALIALLGVQDGARIVWWRSDKLLGAGRDETS